MPAHQTLHMLPADVFTHFQQVMVNDAAAIDASAGEVAGLDVRKRRMSLMARLGCGFATHT